MKTARRIQRKGFTLVEVLIVVVIIGLLVSIAIPAFQVARRSTQNVRFIEDADALGSSFVTFTLKEGIGSDQSAVYDPSTGDIPSGMDPYFDDGLIVTWTEGPTIGGTWDFDDDYGYAGVGAVGYTVQEEQILLMDRDFDDGDFATGRILREGGSRVYRRIAGATFN